MRRFGSASLHSNAAVEKQLPVSLLGFLEALRGAVKPVAVTATGGCFLYLCTREVARAQVQVHLHDKQEPQTLSTGADKQAFGVAADGGAPVEDYSTDSLCDYRVAFAGGVLPDGIRPREPETLAELLAERDL